MIIASFPVRLKERKLHSYVLPTSVSYIMKYKQRTNDQLNEEPYTVHSMTSIPSDQTPRKNCSTKLSIILTAFLLGAIIIAISVVLSTVPFSGSNLTNTTRNNTYRNKTKPDNEIEQILQQMEELETLRCEPRKLKIQVNTTLEDGDRLLSRDFYPQHVAVNRCLDVCSYCSGDGMCVSVPEYEEEKEFVVAFLDERNITLFRILTVTEHTLCKCQ